ncbi:MAG: HD-like signal output (HDOD) protein/signal transduction histidine kinase [Pseudohongiellaceae bacterium]|jgi:HD-like signal output (HDOD) protein/signal transduction histidine kinase
MVQTEQKIMSTLKVDRLPSLPHVLVDMLNACQGNHASFQNISTIISRDAAVSARVISLANTSFYNHGTQISTLERALLVLGTDTIKTIVITASVQQFFSGFNTEHTNFLKQFWKRSLSCALIAKSLAILTSYSNPEEAYLTGLLHNIGELVLETNFSNQFVQMTHEHHDELERIKKEKDIFAVDHASAGAWLAKEWGLSDFAVDAIEFHHAPTESIKDAHHLVKLVYLASHLSNDEKMLFNNVEYNPLNIEVAQTLFELNPSLVNEIVVKIKSEVIDIATSLDIDITAQKLTNTDRSKQVSLAKCIRNIGLLQTATNELNRANSKLELSRAFQNTLELLFGYNNSAVFWYHSKTNDLSFIMPEHPESTSIRFKLEENRSIIAASAIQKKILCTIQDSEQAEIPTTDLPIVDQQIIRLMKTKGLICLPVQSSDTLFCVLVAGCNQAISDNPNQAQLLQYYTDEIASACEDTLRHIQVSENKSNSNELSLRASEIAHEANNPLNIISNYLATLADKLRDNPTIQEELGILKEEVARTSQIILRLRDLEYDTKDTQSGVNINNEINNLSTLFNHSLFAINNITCQLNLDPELTENLTNKNSFKQILTNLFKNAAEAMPAGGALMIRTTASVNVNGKDFVEIRIQDNGTGIPTDIKNNLFMPVTSTKGNGHSGLGLSITKNLVTDAHGTISCRSSAKGTEFQILLPQR